MTDSVHLPTLRLAPGAPEGALPGCRGDLVVSIDHHAGGWSSACEIDVSIDCEATGCWWSRLVYAFTVSAALLDEAKQLHATAAAEGVPAAAARRVAVLASDLRDVLDHVDPRWTEREALAILGRLEEALP